MSSRVRPPVQSFVLFLAVCGLAYAAWHYRDVFTSSPEEILGPEAKQILQEKILAAVGDDLCFSGFRGDINWRPNEQRYVLDIIVEDGCLEEARRLCKSIAELIEREADEIATVTAFDHAGRQIARIVQ